MSQPGRRRLERSARAGRRSEQRVPRGARRRQLLIESLERRWLLAGPDPWGPLLDGEGEPPPAQVAFRLAATDLQGAPLTEVLPGTEIFLEVYVQDIRAGAESAGIFAAYLDVTYSDDLLSVVESSANPLGFDIEFGAEYQNGRWGWAHVPGIIDEAGAFQTRPELPLGADEFLLFRTRMVAGGMSLGDDVFEGIPEDSTHVLLNVLANDDFVTGTAYAASRAADITPAHDVITFSPPRVVAPAEIDFGTIQWDVMVLGLHPITAVTQPNGGGTVLIAPNGEYLIYTPAANFYGTEAFTYTVAGSQTAEVIVQVDPVNDPPVAADHVYRLGRNETLEVDVARGLLRNASDPEDDPLEVALLAPPEYGELLLQPDGSFVYTPTWDFVGTDRFTYVVHDPWLTSNEAEVMLEVGGPRVSIRLEWTDGDGQLVEQVVVGETVYVRAWVRDLRDDFYPDRGVYAAYLDMLFDSQDLQPVVDDQLPLGFEIVFGAAFEGNGSGDLTLPGVVNAVGAWVSIDEASGTNEIELFSMPFQTGLPRTADDHFQVSFQSELNLLDVLSNESLLAWNTTLVAQGADELPEHDVVLWEPRVAVPQEEVVYGTAGLAITNGADLRIVELGATSDGGEVAIGGDRRQVLYRPAAGFMGTETFTYAVADAQGQTVWATVTVEVVPSWQNVRNPLDVNSDTFVSPIDALLVINYLNAQRPSPPVGSPSGPPFWDVNGDGFVSPIDALLVINYLNRQAVGEGEAGLGDATESGTLSGWESRGLGQTAMLGDRAWRSLSARAQQSAGLDTSGTMAIGVPTVVWSSTDPGTLLKVDAAVQRAWMRRTAVLDDALAATDFDPRLDVAESLLEGWGDDPVTAW